MTERRQLSKAAAGATIAIIALVALAADQYTKFLALESLRPGEWVDVLGPVLRLTLVRNPGAAFSLGTGVTWIFTLALGLVALVILYLMLTRVRSRLWALALGGLLGGVLGNLGDRLFREPGFPVGHVVDFINTPWMMPAIYNVADIFIVTSMIGVGLLVLIGVRLDGTRETKSEQTADATNSDVVVGEFSADDRFESRKERRAREAAEAQAADATRDSDTDDAFVDAADASDGTSEEAASGPTAAATGNRASGGTADQAADKQ